MCQHCLASHLHAWFYPKQMETMVMITIAGVADVCCTPTTCQALLQAAGFHPIVEMKAGFLLSLLYR
jgi:hypothetical protein